MRLESGNAMEFQENDLVRIDESPGIVWSDEHCPTVPKWSRYRRYDKRRTQTWQPPSCGDLTLVSIGFEIVTNPWTKLMAFGDGRV